MAVQEWVIWLPNLCAYKFKHAQMWIRLNGKFVEECIQYKDERMTFSLPPKQ
jgi:hypothetical protein